MLWLKNNNIWQLATNNIQTEEFKHSLSNLTLPEETYVYIPVINIHDVFENYRKFRKVYTFTNNSDYLNSFAIQTYSDNEFAASLKGWFPNLIEVKASSSSSGDIITNFTNIETLIIDNVQIFNGEKILLKNQHELSPGFAYQNGIYEFIDNNLTLISEMSDVYKLQNQIVYTYQGETNQNKCFYLKRIEDILDPKFSQYPDINEDKFYSIAEPYLIKSLIKYDLDIPEHPLTDPPYIYTDDSYKLLFLDNKLLNNTYNNISTENLYKLVDNSLSDIDNIELDNVSDIILNNNHNVLFTYLEQKYMYEFDSLKFKYTTDSIEYSNNLTYIHTDSPEYTYQTIKNNNLSPDNVSTLLIDSSPELLPFNLLEKEDLIELTIAATDTNSPANTFEYLKETFILHSYNGSPDYGINIFPQIDENIINEINSLIESGYAFTYTIKLVNYFNSNLQETIENSILSKFYDFNFEQGSPNLEMSLNNIKLQPKNRNFTNPNYFTNNSRYDLDITITTSPEQEFHIIQTYNYVNELSDFELYFKNYLGITAEEVQEKEINIIYRNISNETDRFGIENNIIYFGIDYKDEFLEKVKPNLFYEFSNQSPVVKFYVNSITWDYDSNIGIINIDRNLSGYNNGNALTLSLITNIYNQYYEKIDNELNMSVKDSNIMRNTKSLANIISTYFTDIVPDYRIPIAQKELTGIVYIDDNKPAINLFKRDRNFAFGNEETINVKYYFDTNIDIQGSPDVLSQIPDISNGDLVILNGQTNEDENNLYIYNDSPGILEIYDIEFNFYKINDTYYFGPYLLITSGDFIDSSFRFITQLPYNNLLPKKFYLDDITTKYDKRLTLTPKFIAKLGVDNKIQEWKSIYMKYDSIETEENLLNIEIGINSRSRIRFIDGLTEYNIINNINGQGQYSWILNENVIVDNAIVGCTQTDGPGTGTLIWYSGKWSEGTWVDGIWISGIFQNGTWLSGEFNSYTIQDYYTYVIYNVNTQNNVYSQFVNSNWIGGNFNSGLFISSTWYNGTFNNGIIQLTITPSVWHNGTFNNGIIEQIIWNNGTFNNGEFQKGFWYNGTLNGGLFGNMAEIDSNELNRAIWYNGTFNNGEFGELNNSDNATIFYAGLFNAGTFNSGSFISGLFTNSTWNSGVFFGGYYVSDISNSISSQKVLTIDPAQYDTVLGIITNHNVSINLYGSTFALNAITTDSPDTTFSDIAFINNALTVGSGIYTEKNKISMSNDTITLDITANDAESNTYQQPDPNNNIIDGNPFIYSKMVNSTWNNGIWINGYADNIEFINGSWIDGFANNVIFGE